MDIQEVGGVRNILKLIHTKKSAFWARERERNALHLFKEAARRVPAYKDFMRRERVSPEKIKTFADFQAAVPPINKQNYIKKYPLPMLAWDGHLKKHLVYTSTSGSTGEPVYFPRGSELDMQSSIAHELFLKNSGHQGGPTLVIVAFGMGVWIGGLITYKAFELASLRGEQISIITPGINKTEILKTLRRLGPYYRNIIFAGYPPFLKDVIDAAQQEKIDLSHKHIRLLFAAESFPEKFRDQLARRAYVKNIFLDTMNIYGTADIGTMAYETPVSILLRRMALGRKELFSAMFGDIQKTPTLTQYNPKFITFEAPDGDILVTGNSAIPLIRYAVGDHGGVFNYQEINNLVSYNGLSLNKEIDKQGLNSKKSELPFVYVYERKDLSTTIYGLQIFPEVIREALLDEALEDHLTGKLTMMTKFDAKQNQKLEIHLELREGKKPTTLLKKKALERIVLNLRLRSSEFKELHTYLKHKALPHLVFWPQGHELHFKSDIKQKWVKK